MKLILKELSYEEDGCSMLLQNIETCLPNYKVPTHKTVILIFTAVRASDIIWTE
jgi:hypothetical protein